MAVACFLVNHADHVKAENQSVEFLEILKCVSLSLCTHDVFRWRNNIDCTFSVKSCYTKLNDVIEEENYEVEVLTTLKHVWYSCVASKIKICTWRVLLDMIPTRE